MHHVLGIQMFENAIHQVDSKNEWLLLTARFTENLRWFFVVTLDFEKA